MFECQIADEVALLTLAHPPVNALSREWADGFHKILDDLEKQQRWRVLHIRSNQRVFSAGGDVKQFARRLNDPRAGVVLSDEAAYYQGLFSRIERMPQIAIAEIGGVAAGGGLELALACDLRIASQSAQMGLPEVGLGLLPSAGGTQRMTRLCGRGRALRLIGSAELVSGGEALSLGLVEWVALDTELPGAAAALARRLADQPLEALRAAKSCIAAVFDPQRDGFAEEVAAPRTLMASPETRSKIEAFLARSKR
jgi:enoyl-CoA hydratase/carnithine racemase